MENKDDLRNADKEQELVNVQSESDQLNIYGTNPTHENINDSSN